MELNLEPFLAVIFCNVTLLSWWFHWPTCFLHSSTYISNSTNWLHCTALHCTALRSSKEWFPTSFPLNDSSVQSIYTNTKHCCDHPGLRWRYVRHGWYGGKVGSILCSNWPPVQTRWSDLAFSGLLTLFLRGKNNLHIIMWYNFILSFLTKLVLSTRLDIGLIHFLTNIQLPWPHNWSIG